VAFDAIYRQAGGTATNAQQCNVTLALTPRQGSLMVALWYGQGTAPDVVPGGFGLSGVFADFGGRKVYAYDKVAGAAESKSITFGLNVAAQQTLVVIEWPFANSGTPFQGASAGGTANGSTGVSLGSVTTDAGDLAIAFYGALSEITNSPSITNSDAGAQVTQEVGVGHGIVWAYHISATGQTLSYNGTDPTTGNKGGGVVAYNPGNNPIPYSNGYNCGGI
jgi:hypothetical protein